VGWLWETKWGGGGFGGPECCTKPLSGKQALTRPGGDPPQTHQSKPKITTNGKKTPKPPPPKTPTPKKTPPEQTPPTNPPLPPPPVTRTQRTLGGLTPPQKPKQTKKPPEAGGGVGDSAVPPPHWREDRGGAWVVGGRVAKVKEKPPPEGHKKKPKTPKRKPHTRGSGRAMAKGW